MISRSLLTRRGGIAHASALRGVAGVLVVSALLIAVQIVDFIEPASANTPSTSVLVPSNDAIVSGSAVVLDASASSGTTKLQFVLKGGTEKRTVIGTATPTIYGWIALWNSTTVPNGTYSLRSVAHTNVARERSTVISITVDNPAVTLADLAQSNVTGTGVATLVPTCDPARLAVNVNYISGTSTIGDVTLQIEGCYNSDLTGTFNIVTTNAGTLSGTASGPITYPPPSCPTPSSCGPAQVQFTLTLTATTGTGSFAGTTGSLLVILSSPASAPPTDIPFTGSVAAS